MWKSTTDFGEFNKALKRVAPNVRDAIDGANEKSARQMYDRVDNTVPERDGELRDTLRLTAGNTDKMEHGVAIGSETALYSIPLEFGHTTKNGVRVEGKHYWVPARTITLKSHRTRLKRALRKALKNTWRLF